MVHVMVYGSSADLATTEKYLPPEEFRRAIENAPAGLFTEEIWRKWHIHFGMEMQPLPMRRLPDGSLGPEPGRFFGR